MFATLFFLFCSQLSLAIEHTFEGNATTSVGAVSLADQPAGLAWLDKKWSFSASAVTLEQKVYEIAGTGYQSDPSPFSFKPMYVASGFGESWGGWAFQVDSKKESFRSRRRYDSSGYSNKVQIDASIETFQATQSFGLRLGEQWALGFGIKARQEDTRLFSQGTADSTSESIFATVDSQEKKTILTGVFSTLLNLKYFRWGLSATPPGFYIAKTSESKTTVLTSTTSKQNVSETSRPLPIDELKNWTLDTGVRFGQEGSCFFLADQFQTSGQHRVTGGFEYRAKWGLLTVSLAHARDTNDTEERTLTTGLVKKGKDFDWGIGPSYSQFEGGKVGALNSKAYSIVYASEIRY